MLRQLAVFVFFLLPLVSSLSAAMAGENEAKALLTSVLSKEFEGDELARRDHVLYSHVKSPTGDCDCSTPLDTWSLDQDSFNIVSSWDIVGSKAIIPGKYTINVRFHVIARAMHTFQPGWVLGNFRQIFVPPSTKDEVVAYVLVAHGPTWEILDPPEPRVSPQALRNKLNNQIGTETNLRDRGQNEHDDKTVAYREAAISGYMTEINSLRYAVLVAGLPSLQ